MAIALAAIPSALDTVPFSGLRPAVVASAQSSQPRLRATRDLRPSQELSLRRGQTLGDALRDLGLGASEAQSAAAAVARYVDLRSLQPGDRYRAFFDSRAAVPAAVQLSLPGRGDVRLDRRGETWDPSWRPYQRTIQVKTLSAILTGSLDAVIRGAGGNPMLAYKMSDVLQWDLDFNRDLRTGARFRVLYEEIYLDGQPWGLGNIVALRYENGARQLEAFRYGDDAYYDAEGRPLEKMFLRSPLPYSHVTSQFSMHRFHPVLKVFRPHYGVDFGAPIGTPVRVTASGTIVSAGWDGGGGKAVKVRHSNGFVTEYLHLSGYASGTQPGARVRQGEVIAFTGMTGRATGPHLDYRVQHYNDWIDPMSLPSVPAPPIPGQELPGFRVWRDALRASLANGAPLPPAPYLAAPGTRLASVPAAKTAAKSADLARR